MPARRHAEDAIAIAEEAQHLPSLAGASANAGLAYLLQGDLAAAIPVLERGVALLRSLHFKAPAALSFLAWGYALAGRVDEALPLFEQSLDWRPPSSSCPATRSGSSGGVRRIFTRVASTRPRIGP